LIVTGTAPQLYAQREFTLATQPQALTK